MIDLIPYYFWFGLCFGINIGVIIMALLMLLIFKKTRMVRRKVVCVWGEFDDKSDFVLEPSCPESCSCDICKGAFWIEDLSGRSS